MTDATTVYFCFCVQCSKICDGGVKYRKVRCQQLLALGEIADKPAKLCPKNSPDTERPCNPQPCSSYDYEKKSFDVRNDEGLGCASEFDRPFSARFACTCWSN